MELILFIYNSFLRQERRDFLIFFKFADMLDSILHDSQPRKFIFQVNTRNFRKKIIKCFMESLTGLPDKHYIIGIFCDFSENAIFVNQN